MKIIKHMEDSSFVSKIVICLGKIPERCQPFPGSAPESLANPVLDPNYLCINLLGSLARIGLITLYAPCNIVEVFWK